jgi:biotin carboxyl carrier protein
MKKLLITVNGQKYEVEVEVLEDDFNQVSPQVFQNTKSIDRSAVHSVELQSKNLPKFNEVTSFLSSRQNQPAIKTASKNKQLNSPLNGTVLEINAKPGVPVKEKEILLAIEAMKMKTNIFAEFAGVVKSVNVSVGDKVSQGTILITFE